MRPIMAEFWVTEQHFPISTACVLEEGNVLLVFRSPKHCINHLREGLLPKFWTSVYTTDFDDVFLHTLRGQYQGIKLPQGEEIGTSLQTPSMTNEVKLFLKFKLQQLLYRKTTKPTLTLKTLHQNLAKQQRNTHQQRLKVSQQPNDNRFSTIIKAKS